MTTKNRTSIAILVAVCLSLGGYSETLAYRGKSQRSSVSRTMRPEADALFPRLAALRHSTSVHERSPLAAIFLTRNVPPFTLVDGGYIPAARQVSLTVFSSNPSHNRAPPSA